MNNRDIQAAWSYHDGTKHSSWSIHNDLHYNMDFENQPLPFKIYQELEPIPLPSDLLPRGISALDAISGTGLQTDGDRVPDLATLASIFYHSAGITRRRSYGGGEILFGRRPAQVPSITSSCTWCAPTYQVLEQGCTISGPTTSRLGS